MKITKIYLIAKILNHESMSFMVFSQWLFLLLLIQLKSNLIFDYILKKYFTKFFLLMHSEIVLGELGFMVFPDRIFML